MTDHAVIDLRSDTVTRPTPAMREAMARADVGDDQFGEDPSVNRLQERVAALLGQEAALWFPTGTMANQVALRTLTRPGDEVLVAREAHVLWHETGGASATSGVQLTEIGPGGGRFTPDEVAAIRKPRGHLLQPPSTVVSVENTHNRAGGVVWTAVESLAITTIARELELATFLDGARLWNAAAALDVPPSELAGRFDVVNVAFSKGLGAPGGSMLAGSRAFIDDAVRYRRMAGGAMRQVGVFAAAADHALDHHLERLAEDHANARLLADRLAESPAFELDPDRVQTNIVVFRTAEGADDAPAVVARAREAGVLVVAFTARTIRAVTHLDVTRDEVAEAAERLVAAGEGAS
ncbi:MAG TPA: low specificity L-threonine aldolase [Candidatus Limnocylindrales bacterium]